MDFLFFPLDTIKTRIQSTKGFWHSGGFKGVYRGIGSVGMGSAPSGESFTQVSLSPLDLHWTLRPRLTNTAAAIFFVSYETFKAALPWHSSFLADSPSFTHVVAASGAEFVSRRVGYSDRGARKHRVGPFRG